MPPLHEGVRRADPVVGIKMLVEYGTNKFRDWAYESQRCTGLLPPRVKERFEFGWGKDMLDWVINGEAGAAVETFGLRSSAATRAAASSSIASNSMGGEEVGDEGSMRRGPWRGGGRGGRGGGRGGGHVGDERPPKEDVRSRSKRVAVKPLQRDGNVAKVTRTVGRVCTTHQTDLTKGTCDCGRIDYCRTLLDPTQSLKV